MMMDKKVPSEDTKQNCVGDNKNVNMFHIIYISRLRVI